MRKPPGIDLETTRIVPVLSVSPAESDHESLEDILGRLGCSESKARWTVCRSFTLASAMSALQDYSIPLVVSADEVPPAIWTDVLAHISSLPHCPLLIVTSRHADDYFWAEARNVGAYGVLANPFNATEVIRVIGSAWLHWKDQHAVNQARPKHRKAAG